VTGKVLTVEFIEEKRVQELTKRVDGNVLYQIDQIECNFFYYLKNLSSFF